jgi:tRNA pseudouridine38-40 synthase
MRYFIYLSYNGAQYCGWQFQPNALSVQQELEGSLSLFLRRQIAVVGAGRTDAGVHARLMIAHFDWEGDPLDVEWATKKVNLILSPDIVVRQIVRVSPDAHARFDALRRTYRYYVSFEKDPFRHEFTYLTHETLDVEAMNRAAAKLKEYSDFTSFSKLHTDVKSNRCSIVHAHWEWCGQELVFTVCADRFLRGMVRAIVGTLFKVGRGKLSIEGFCRIIESKSRSLAGDSVPAHALFLEDVVYPSSIAWTPDTERREAL